MTIRPYIKEDKKDCIEIFRSNCPLYFDQSEMAMFSNWLDHQAGTGVEYKSPTYSNAEHDAFYVVVNDEGSIVGCGGFYIAKDVKEARFAWGMIHEKHHGQGIGTLLYKHRKEEIQKNWPDHKLTLGTSQHTYLFYQKMGMKVVDYLKSGYGEDLDRYDMEG